MQGSRHPLNEFAAITAAATRLRNGQVQTFERSDGFPKGIKPITNRLIRRLAVGDTFAEVGEGNQVAATFFIRQRSNFKRIFSRIAHGSVRHKLHKLLDIDRFDRPICRYGQSLAVISNEDNVTGAALSPLNIISTSYCLKLLNPPILRIIAHLFKQFFDSTHGYMILYMMSIYKGWRAKTFTEQFALPVIYPACRPRPRPG